MFKISGQFRTLLDKATSSHNLEPDWSSILAICDMIRSGDVSGRVALDSISTKLSSDNPHVQRSAVTVLESCAKNCGRRVISEVENEDFMLHLRQLIKSTSDEVVRNQVLAMIQSWSTAFRDEDFPVVKGTYDLLRAEGWNFPAESEKRGPQPAAMFEANVAPDWQGGDVCSRCRSAFSMLSRQHHCRACGFAYCAKCSNNFCPLAQFGIEKPVRVCDSCFEKRRTKSSSRPAVGQQHASSRQAVKLTTNSNPEEERESAEGKPIPTEEDEEEQLQLALALSQSEAEASTSRKQVTFDVSQNKVSAKKKDSSLTTKSGLSNAASLISDADDDDLATLSPELYRYLNRDYWKSKEEQLAQSKTVGDTEDDRVDQQSTSVVANDVSSSDFSGQQTNFTSMSDDSPHLSEIRRQTETFTNRVRSNAARGKYLFNDQSIQTMLVNVMHMHSSLFEKIKEAEAERAEVECLQEKVGHIRDRRAALDALRAEDAERRLVERKHAEAVRQMQISHKLSLLRQEKQQRLQIQHQLALEKLTREQRELATGLPSTTPIATPSLAGQSTPHVGPPTHLQYGPMPPTFQPMMQPPFAHTHTADMMSYPAYQQQYSTLLQHQHQQNHLQHFHVQPIVDSQSQMPNVESAAAGVAPGNSTSDDSGATTTSTSNKPNQPEVGELITFD